ncbi:hypothetical protein FB451DRAFT_1534872 [Mycena latifolia]|nr:hypothetical protein FB451DRAFT_1534872 [Mycena latifolia]
MNPKSAAADAKGTARATARVRGAPQDHQERIKRQGGKERVAELENNLQSLQRRFDLTQKRNQQLNEVVEAMKLPPGCTNLNIWRVVCTTNSIYYYW